MRVKFRNFHTGLILGRINSRKKCTFFVERGGCSYQTKTMRIEIEAFGNVTAHPDLHVRFNFFHTLGELLNW